MKLRNKKTGEIAIFGEGIVDLTKIGCKNVAEMIAKGWEDYEEPKSHHWYIEPRGEAIELVFGDDFEELKQELSEIGNYFGTREEAEKAVEKLKAWKRLKDKEFEFVGCFKDNTINFEFVGHPLSYDEAEEAEQDLAFIFGGEE